MEFNEWNHLPNYFKTGLSSEEVSKLQEEGKVNKTKSQKSKSIIAIICKNLFTFFNFLLFTIAIILMIFNQWSNMVFMVIVLANLILGLIQDFRAKITVDKLSFKSKSKYTVIRDSKEVSLYDEELVLGDILILRGSDLIPCDSRVLKGNCYVNEGILTGESDKIKKEEGSLLLSGSYITSGEVYVLVEKVAEENYINALSNKSKEFKAPKSKLFTQINSIFKILSIIVAVLGIMQIIVVCFTNRTIVSGQIPTYEMIGAEIIAPICGALISMIPSGMYLLFSTTLVAGVLTLSRKNVLVHDMYSIDMLARADVLCIDKTGTITTGNMFVNKLEVLKSSPFNENELHLLISNVNFAINDMNTTATALKGYFGVKNGYEIKNVIHFDSANKYSAASFEGIGTIVLGAYGFIKSINDNEDIAKKVIDYSNKGERVLMIAFSKEIANGETLPNDLRYIGIITIEDEIKPDAEKILNWFRQNDVRIKILSGDNELTVKNIALKVNLQGASKSVSLNDKDDYFINQNVEDYDVFGRVSPEQKKTVIEALRNNGHVVAMFGDGVNDILAFKAADVSISVADGANAAKDLASLILTDNNFGGLPEIVSQGRRVINNLQRTCSLFLVKTCFSMILNTFFVIYGLTSGVSWPFAPGSFYAWELASIGISSFLLALEPNSERIKGNFIKNIFANAIPPGIILSLTVAIFYIIADVSPIWGNAITEDTLRTIATWYISVAALFVLIEVCLPINLYRLCILILAAVLIVVIFVWSIYGVNWLSLEGDAPRLLSTSSIIDLCVLIVITLVLLIAVWIFKYIYRSRKLKKEFSNNEKHWRNN